MTVRLCYSGNL